LRATEDVIDDSNGGMEAKNTKFKERIRELENALMPLPLLFGTLSIVRPTTPSLKLKGSSILLTTSRSYVERNIKKRMALITKVWEVSKNIVSFGLRAHAFHEYLQVDLKNKEGFYIDIVLTFGTKFSNMTENKKKRGGSSLPKSDKYLNACWKEKIKILNNIV
jgi:hypothetical protein